MGPSSTPAWWSRIVCIFHLNIWHQICPATCCVACSTCLSNMYTGCSLASQCICHCILFGQLSPFLWSYPEDHSFLTNESFHFAFARKMLNLGSLLVWECHKLHPGQVQTSHPSLWPISYSSNYMCHYAMRSACSLVFLNICRCSLVAPFLSRWWGYPKKRSNGNSLLCDRNHPRSSWIDLRSLY